MAFGVLSAITPPDAYAQSAPSDSAAAQVLFDQAKKLMAEGRYADACPKLEESERLDAGSGTLLNLGDCYEHLGMFATAWGKFVEAAAVAKASGNAGRERVSRDRAVAVQPRVSNIVVNVGDAGATPGFEVRRDGAIVGKAQWATPMPADPGEHFVSASAPDKKGWQSKVTVGKTGQTFTVSVPRLEPNEGAVASSHPLAASPPVVPVTLHSEGAPTQPAPIDEARPGLGAQKLLALGVGAVGVAGLVVGTVFGLQSKSKHDEAAPQCAGGCNDDQGVQLMNDARTAGNISTVAFVVGLAGVAGAATLWLTSPSSKSSATARVGVSPTGIALRASW
jgi:serine/threonine-protein kinase